MNNTTRSLAQAVFETKTSDAPRIIEAICDTAAVAAAGFGEPVTRAVLAAYDGGAVPNWNGTLCESGEAAVLINATAAHALDYDDVYLDSQVHASAVLTPVVLYAASGEEQAVAAFGAGLVAIQVMAKLLGPGHYRQGWHGTGTIGAFGAAASAARALELTCDQTRSAFALVAAMSGGLQSNFGSMAKPCQAGFAASAGLRAARLALAGVEGPEDAIGNAGYLGLYGRGESQNEIPKDVVVPQPFRMSMKLFPSCFAAARLVGVALDAREMLGPIFGDPTVTVTLIAPADSLEVLRFDNPRTGAEAKFSAPFNLAIALVAGTPTVAQFETTTLADQAVSACMARITVDLDERQSSGGDIRFGSVVLEVRRRGQMLGRFKRSGIPGSPEDPATPQQLKAKWVGCLATYQSRTGRPFSIDTVLSVIPAAKAMLQPIADEAALLSAK